jgi:TrkA domain protein
MSKIEETKLPGVGIRFDFITQHGQRLGVVHTLADVLGVSPVIEEISQLQQIEGLALDWLPIESDSVYAGRTIGDAAIRTRTGVSVVAVIRGDTPHPAPGPEFKFEVDDTAVVVGTAQGIEAVKTILASG